MPNLRLSACLAFALFFVASGCSEPLNPQSGKTGEPLLIACAANLSLAMEELSAAFSKRAGVEVKNSFGASGLLARKIREGAPFDVFVAADPKFVTELVPDKLVVAESRREFAHGALAVWRHKDAATPVLISFADLAKPEYKRVAIANPKTAPFGAAAKAALEKSGLWAAIEPRVVYGDDIKATLQFAESGNADLAITALNLAVAATGGQYAAVESTLHAPLLQSVVAVAASKRSKDARAFCDFLSSPEAQAILKRHGYLIPDTATAGATR